MAALDNIASELLKAANVADLNFKKTRDQAERDKAVRLRRIVENLKAISAGGLTPTLDQVLTEGNTSTNTLNVGGITTDYVQLDTAATPTLAPGMFGWNDAYGTADLRLKGNNVTLQLGQETLARVVNKTGSDLLESEYKVVRVRIASEGGAQGQRLAVVLAQGNNDPDSVTTLGIVTETIPNNQEGFITVFGNVNGINTTGSLQGETWVDGDVLYLSPTTPGALTNVKPIAPNHTVTMGYVVYAHNNQGKIFVKVDNGYELDELHNVLITSPANNDLLQYNSAQQVWKNVASSVAVPTPTLAQVTTAGNTTTNAITVGGLTTSGNITFSAYNRTVGSASYPASAVYTNDLYSVNNIRSGGGTNGLSFYDNGGTLQMRIWGTGNVTINSATDAGYKLDVTGTARVTGVATANQFNSTNAGGSFQFSGVNLLDYGNGVRIGYSASVTRIAMYTNSGTERLTILNGGFVGFSQTTPTANIHTSLSVTAASALARGVYFNNTLVQSAASDVLTAFEVAPTFTVDPTLLHNVYWLRFTGAYSPSVYNNPNNNATTIDLSNSFSNTFNAIGLRIRHTYSNVQNGYGILLESAGFIGIAQTSSTSINYFAGTTVIGSGIVSPASGYSLHVINNTNGAIKIGGAQQANQHLVISHSESGATFSSIRNTFNNANSTMLIDVAGQNNLRLWGTGNVVVGGTTDAGYKLDVNGSTIVRGTFVNDSGGGGFYNAFTTNYGGGFAGRFSGNANPTTLFVNHSITTASPTGISSGIVVQFGGTSGGTASIPHIGVWTRPNIGNGSIKNTYGYVSDFPNSSISAGSVLDNHAGFLSGSTGSWAYSNSTITNLYGFLTSFGSQLANNTTVTNYYGIYLNSPTVVAGSSVTNKWGVYQQDSAANNYFAGNLGIGTSTPTDKLHIVDNTNGNKFGRISAGGSDASAAWVAQNDQVDNVVYRVFSSGVTGTQMGINLARSASLMANLGGSGKFLVGTYSSTDFVMGTGNQERMRLVDSTGNFLIGTTVDNGNRLTVNGTIDSTGYRINNVAGYTGILNIPGNPPGQQNVDIQGGIIINIF